MDAAVEVPADNQNGFASLFESVSENREIGGPIDEEFDA